MELRAHQKVCTQKIAECFQDSANTSGRGLVKMFCGSGKSMVIYDTVLAHGDDICVVVVPSIHLVTQFKRDYLIDETKKKYNQQNYGKEFEILTVCSLDELNDSKDTFTTDEQEITDFLFAVDKEKVVLITYQSLPKFVTIVQETETSIDLVCFDEAHHILGMKMKHLLFGYDDDEFECNEAFEEECLYESTSFLDCVKKTLFFTATPKNSNGIVMYEIPETLGYELDDEYDENTEVADEPHCGPMLFEYTHRNGVDDGILNDFKIRVDMYTENTDKSVFEAVSRSILETGNTRVLTFHSRSFVSAGEKSNVETFSTQKKEFLESFQRVCQQEFPMLQKKYRKIRFEGMTSKTKNRMKLLQQFDETPDDEIFILSSCKTINEGVDTKRANMVVFVDEKQSFIEITQNIGRVCRKQENLSTIVIPCYVDVKKYADCVTDEDRDLVIRQEMAKGGNFNGILNVLSALRQEDPYIFELCLKYPERYTDQEIRNNLKKSGLELLEREYSPTELFREYGCEYDSHRSEESNFRHLQNKIQKNLQVINNSVLDEDLYLEYPEYQSTEIIYKTESGYKKTKGKDKEQNVKISKPNRNVKINVHASDAIKVLWKMVSDTTIQKKIFGGFIECEVRNLETSEDRWIETLDRVSKYIDENKKLPSYGSKNKEIKSMGRWIAVQKVNYKRGIFSMKSPNVRKLWEFFLKKYPQYFKSAKEIWMQKLQLVKDYIHQHKKTPSTSDKDSETKSLGSWIQTQKKNYKRYKGTMKDPEIRKLWEGFAREYLEYFLSNIEVWKQKLDHVKQYLNKNEKRPSDSDKNTEIKSLGLWVRTQKQNYERNDKIMKDSEIRMLWEDFTQEYSEYFLSKTEVWMQKLQQVKYYIDQNKKTPSCSDKNTEIKRLGVWVSTQKQNYERNDNIMKDPEIRKLWEDFTQEYLEYLVSNTEFWKQQLDHVKQYLNKNEKTPSCSDKNSETKSLGQWIKNQKKNYEKNENIMKDAEIRQVWESFTQEYLEYLLSNTEIWMQKLQQVKDYIHQHKKTPSCKDKDSEIKSLGEWIQTQKKNYEKNEKIMKDAEIRHVWECFTQEFSEYLLSNTEVWIQKLQEVKDYIHQHKKTPSSKDKNSETKSLGTWIQKQKKNYEKNEFVMKDAEIRQVWESFTQEYLEYLLSNTDIWMQKLQQVKDYIHQHKKTPSGSDKNSETKSLGLWIQTQKKNFEKNEHIMKYSEMRKLWEDFTQEYLEYFLSSTEIWMQKLQQVKDYIHQHKKTPSQHDKNPETKSLGQWIGIQKRNNERNENIMKDPEIRKLWEDFTQEYLEYFISNTEVWMQKLIKVKEYINQNKKTPSKHDKNPQTKSLGYWISDQKQNYEKNEHIMKDPEIRQLWEQFKKEYLDEKKPARKSTKITPTELKEKSETEQDKVKRKMSDYQVLCKKMSVQHSQTTSQQFASNPEQWHDYHDARDFSFLGYDNQDEIPVNKIISYLKTKEKRRLRILDLGCGRNLIKNFFERNSNFSITGYDHVSFNGSIACDISSVPDQNESVSICVFSQSLMGSNWQSYLKEAKRVLTYNGEIIISESAERFSIVKETVIELGFTILKEEYEPTNRWFFIFALNSD